MKKDRATESMLRKTASPVPVLVHVPVPEKAMELDHEKLDVCRVNLDFAGWAYERSRALKGADRHARGRRHRVRERERERVRSGFRPQTGGENNEEEYLVETL